MYKTEIHLLIPGTCECVTLRGKWLSDVIKHASLERGESWIMQLAQSNQMSP